MRDSATDPSFEFELADRICQLVRLVNQRFSRSRSLFHQGRILLRGFIHAGHRLVHLVNTSRLLSRRC